MALTDQIKSLVDVMASKFNAVTTRMGSLTNLQTSSKSSLVAAINELATRPVDTGVKINDAAPSALTTYSGTKIEAVARAEVAKLVDGAPEELDTLKEISTKLKTEDTALAGLLATLGVRVAVDAAQTFTAVQQAQARANIGAVAASDIGDFNHDFVADFNNALSA